MPPLTLRGLVTKAGLMNKTVTVSVTRFKLHPVTKKRIERTKKYLTHDEQNQLRPDDVVIIRNCPKRSARKAFTLDTLVRSPEAERKLAREQMAAQLAQEARSTTPISELIKQY
ncbi:hypothetical protein C8J56DRAFT_918657 [Mycena floridula]|nr:hypothetical protein C8J56DRAFT_918657 [Mycena floridula]